MKTKSDRGEGLVKKPIRKEFHMRKGHKRHGGKKRHGGRKSKREK